MNNTIRVLTVLLASQVVLAGYTLLQQSSLATKNVEGTLLNFDKAQVDQVTIQGPDNSSVALVKQNGQWVIPSVDNFPADATKVNTALESLHDLKHAAPVATSGSDLARFKVEDSNFERHIQLHKGTDTVGDIYLGNGSGLRQSYARLPNDKTVYTAAIGTFDLPAIADNWEDKTILKLNESDLHTLSIAGGLKLTRTVSDGKTKTSDWQAANLEAGKLVNQQAVNDLASKLMTLSFAKVLGKEAKPEYGLDKQTLNIAALYGTNTRLFQFTKLKDSEDYVLKVSDKPEYFKVDSVMVKPLLEGSSTDKLVTASVAPTSASTAATNPAASSVAVGENQPPTADAATPATPAGEPPHATTPQP